MAGCVYHLLRYHTSTSAKRIEVQIETYIILSSGSGFPLSDHANLGDFISKKKDV